MNAIIKWFRLRITARPYNIWSMEVCEPDRNEGYWLCEDGFLYYGNRWLVFNKSHQNSWFKDPVFNKYRNSSRSNSWGQLNKRKDENTNRNLPWMGNIL